MHGCAPDADHALVMHHAVRRRKQGHVIRIDFDPVKKYVVRLSGEERERLETLVSKTIPTYGHSPDTLPTPCAKFLATDP